MNKSKKRPITPANNRGVFRIAEKRLAKRAAADSQVADTSIAALHPDLLKERVRDLLARMTTSGRGVFMQALDREMRGCQLNVRAYLVPLGIAAQMPEELTPTEIGHLIRFLKMMVPQALPAVERVVRKYELLAQESLASEARSAA